MFTEIIVFTSSNTANIDVGTLQATCINSATYRYTNMCKCMVFILKLRSSVFTTTFCFTKRCTTLVECITYMFTEINVFTSSNTANIVVGTLQECITCMNSATYSYKTCANS